MASSPEVTTYALAEAARRSQVALRNRAVAEVARTWDVLDFDRLTRTWPVWLQTVTDILTGYHAQSADGGALFYRAVRQHELGEPGVASLAAPPAEEWLTKALGYAAPGVYAKSLRRGEAPQQAAHTALTKTLGVSSRIVLDGSRTTVAESVAADPRARGFQRVTDGDPCAFCALVASRGPVYRFAQSAGEGNAYHDDCGCTATPAFTRTIRLSPVAQQANDIYHSEIAHLPNRERMSAFRKAWAARAA